MLTEEEVRRSDNTNGLQKPQSASQVIDSIGYGKFQFILTIIVGIANLCDAMEMMMLSLIGPILTCSPWRVSTASVASLTTAVFLGMSIASPLWGFLTDNYGRSKTLIVSSFLLLIFGGAAALSPSFKWLLILRFFCGMFISCMPQGITLLMEYLPSQSRARANIFLALLWACGGSATIMLGRFCMNIKTEYQWRIILGVGTIPLFLYLLCSFWVPESILYLVQNQNRAKAQEILKRIQILNNLNNDPNLA